MAQPSNLDVHIDAALTDFSIAYIQDEANFVAGQVFPEKPVDHQTDKYFIFDKNDWLRDDAVGKRAPGEVAPRSGFTLGTDSYSADAWWTEVPLSNMVISNQDPALMLDQAATRLVTQRMLIRRERIFASKFFTAGVWGTSLVGGTDFTLWSDYSSDPQTDIDTGRETVLVNTGRMPNCLTVGFKVHNALKRHPLIKDMYKYTSAASITEDMIAKAFELDKYVVAKASYATNAEGGTKAYAFANGNNALLTYNDGSTSIMEPCAGAIFAWTGLNPGGGSNVAIDQRYDPNTMDDIVRGQFAFDMKVTGADLGYFFGGAV